MKRLQNILIIGGFALTMIIFYGGLTLWVVGCEDSYKQETLPEFKEVKMDMTLDDFDLMAGDWGMLAYRATNDPIFDWVWLWDSNREDSALFNNYCIRQEAFIKTWPRFDSLWTHGLLRFHKKFVRGNPNCKYFGFESIDCNWEKIVKAAYSDGTRPDFIHMWSVGNGFGTGNNGISILGVGTGEPIYAICSYWETVEWILQGLDPGRGVKLTGHENGHALGLDHYFPQGNIMWYATNYGCALGWSFLPFQQDIYLTYINSRIN